MNNDRTCDRIERVAIIGAGAVGSTTAYAMIQTGSAHEIILSDINMHKAEGEMMDLSHTVPFTRPVDIHIAEASELEDCDLVIINAGLPQKPGQSRLDVVKGNVEIYRSFYPMLNERNPDAFHLIVTNPVDVMTRVAIRLSGLPPHQVFGSGTVLDTARFRSLLSMKLGIQARNIHGYIIGEHGDSEVPVWSRVMIGALSLGEYCEDNGIGISPDDTETITRETREAAYRIIERKGATNFAIATACVMIAEALTQRTSAVYTVSRACSGEYGIDDVCLSLPTLINMTGAHRTLELELSRAEREALVESAGILDKVYAGLDLEQ